MWFDKQTKALKILLLIPVWGWITSGVYRIVNYKSNHNKVSLIFGILCIVPFVGFFVSICDLITEILEDKISILVD